MKKVTKSVALVAAFATLLASCGGSSDSSDTSAAAATDAPMTTDESTTVAPSGPQVTIVEGTEFPAGAETMVTVQGTGFSDLALGSRPPLEGIPTGIYVVFGTFDDVWRPSEGAPASARRTVADDQMWAMPAASRAVLDPENLLPNVFEIDDAGNFTVTIPVSKIEGTGTYAVAVYPASGAIKAEHEFLFPITFID
jgi:hypothetical protein